MTSILGDATVSAALPLVLVLLAAVLLWILRTVSYPTVEIISRYVRPDEEEFSRGAPRVRDCARVRLFVQNLDGAVIERVAMILGTGEPTGSSGAAVVEVSANGGAGVWAPVVMSGADAAGYGVAAAPAAWVVYCEAGMRPHATWRVEIEVEPTFREIDVTMFGYRRQLGRQATSVRIGPGLGLGTFLQLTALLLALAGLAWTALLGAPTPGPAVEVASVLIVGWSLLLYALIRPAQAGVMSGWTSRGHRRRRPKA